MWLQVLWILWTLWFVLDPAWDLFASGVEWLLSMGVLGWFLGLVALAWRSPCSEPMVRQEGFCP